MKVTNKGKERQGVHTTSGVVFIHPGKSRDVELTEAGEKLVRASQDLSIDGRTRKVPETPSEPSEASEA
ncbi:hypothetical protein B5M44_24020 [Shinella sumterensis]|uniref:hypothetical protein n=1 Tax=Shinella sumterensis TaxID=1967501 RepID=UPI00106E0138|nr:hypothetical protein [Shinella sumterensis]MCD1264538.1 hypothetical protein [Shinella sumterensis]TFE94089.1 hypothetical protein B5M44_24020 [Shinella sumterensis]